MGGGDGNKINIKIENTREVSKKILGKASMALSKKEIIKPFSGKFTYRTAMH